MKYILRKIHDKPTSTVYGYVPVELVVAEINLHGGVLEGGK